MATHTLKTIATVWDAVAAHIASACPNRVRDLILDHRDLTAALASAQAEIAALRAERDEERRGAEFARSENDRLAAVADELLSEHRAKIMALRVERDGLKKAVGHQWQDRRKAAIREAVTWLHRRAGEMNDPNARSVLNGAAFHLPELYEVRPVDGTVTLTPSSPDASKGSAEHG